MSRNARLYDRLDTLEGEYRQRLTEEFEKAAVGDWSAYLSRKTPHLIDGKGHVDGQLATLEKMESKILSLRGKLGEDTPGRMLGLLEEFLAEDRGSSDRSDGRRRALARSYLETIMKSSSPSSPPPN